MTRLVRGEPGIVVAPSMAGVEALWRERVLNVNGQSVEPSLFLVGTDFDDTAKTLADRVTGTVLAEAGAGASPTKGYAPWGRDGAVVGAGGKDLRDAGTTLGDLGARDFHIGALIRAPTTAGNYAIISKRVASGGLNGWTIYVSSAYLLRMALDVGATQTDFSLGITIAAGAWGLLDIWCNRDEPSANGLVSYWNGAAGTGSDQSAYAATLDNGGHLSVGSQYGTLVWNTLEVAHVDIHSQASWFAAGAAGPTSWLDLAKRRTELLFGAAAPHHVAGTPRPSSW